MSKLKNNLTYIIFSIFILLIAVASINYYSTFIGENEPIGQAANKTEIGIKIILTKNKFYPIAGENNLPIDNFLQQKPNFILNFDLEIWQVLIAARNSFPNDINDLIYCVNI